MRQGLSPEMSRSPIKGKFDEIVDFAEVEKFLDMSRRLSDRRLILARV